MEMEFNKDIETHENSEDLGLKTRVKTSNRINYEAQVDVIRKQIGDLENIRSKLQLSQRKIAQLLLVDPSAWSRWVSKGETAPPHIYRALQWYMTLQEQVPGLNASYFLQKDTQGLKSEIKTYAEGRLADMELQIKQAQQDTEEQFKNLYSDLKERTDKIVHQSSRDILKLEEEVAFLKSEASRSERELKTALKTSKGFKRWLYFFTFLAFVLFCILVGSRF